MPGDTRCISHSEDPKVQELKRRAVIKGGTSRGKRPLALPKIELRSSEDVHRVLAETLTLLRTDALDPPKAKAILSLCRELLPILQELKRKKELAEDAARAAKMLGMYLRDDA